MNLYDPDTTMEALAKLRTVFKADGTVTAGTSSPLSDGAGFVVLMSGDKVKRTRRDTYCTIRWL